jgi:hypothetical protein
MMLCLQGEQLDVYFLLLSLQVKRHFLDAVMLDKEQKLLCRSFSMLDGHAERLYRRSLHLEVEGERLSVRAKLLEVEQKPLEGQEETLDMKEERLSSHLPLLPPQTQLLGGQSETLLVSAERRFLGVERRSGQEVALGTQLLAAVSRHIATDARSLTNPPSDRPTRTTFRGGSPSGHRPIISPSWRMWRTQAVGGRPAAPCARGRRARAEALVGLRPREREREPERKGDSLRDEQASARSRWPLRRDADHPRRVASLGFPMVPACSRRSRSLARRRFATVASAAPRPREP